MHALNSVTFHLAFFFFFLELIIQKNLGKIKFQLNWVRGPENPLNNDQFGEDLALLSSAEGSTSNPDGVSEDAD